MCLCLCDTNAPEDLHINDELVKADYADFVPDKSPQSSSPDGQVFIKIKYIFWYAFIVYTFETSQMTLCNSQGVLLNKKPQHENNFFGQNGKMCHRLWLLK